MALVAPQFSSSKVQNLTILAHDQYSERPIERSMSAVLPIEMTELEPDARSSFAEFSEVTVCPRTTELYRSRGVDGGYKRRRVGR